MQDIIRFNTGRGYTDEGQRIAARQLHDGRVVFVDIDRGLDYVTNTPCELTPRAVMRAYDYDNTAGTYSIADDYAVREKLLDELRAAARALT